MKKTIQTLITKLDHGCAPVAHLSSVSLDRPLSLRERLERHIHFMICDYCRRYHRQLEFIQMLARDDLQEDQNGQPEGPGLNDDARQRIRASLEFSIETPSKNT